LNMNSKLLSYGLSLGIAGSTMLGCATTNNVRSMVERPTYTKIGRSTHGNTTCSELGNGLFRVVTSYSNGSPKKISHCREGKLDGKIVEWGRDGAFSELAVYEAGSMVEPEIIGTPRKYARVDTRTGSGSYLENSNKQGIITVIAGVYAGTVKLEKRNGGCVTIGRVSSVTDFGQNFKKVLKDANVNNDHDVTKEELRALLQKLCRERGRN